MFRASSLILIFAACSTPEPHKRAAAVDDGEALLLSLGYLEAVEPAKDGPTGVTVNDAARAQPGTNLVASAHERVIRELDATGDELRRWTLPAASTRPTDPTGFRRVIPTDDGGVVAILEGRALVRFAADGALRWRTDCWAHHDVSALPDGGFLTLTRSTVELDEISRKQPTVDDRVTWISANGQVTRTVSVLGALKASRWWGLVHESDKPKGDVLHTNAVELLDGRAERLNPAFAKGNLLVTMNYLSAVGVIDPAQERFVWLLAGKEFKHPHDATLRADGTLQVFDNEGAAPWSAIRWYEVHQGRQIGSFQGSETFPFATKNCGSATALPNQNLLVVEANHGRAFELAPDHSVVWSWQSPFRGTSATDRVANLNDLVRVPPP